MVSGPRRDETRRIPVEVRPYRRNSERLEDVVDPGFGGHRVGHWTDEVHRDLQRPAGSADVFMKMLTNVVQITSTIEDIGHPASADVYARIQIESLGKVIDGLVENFIESLRWSDQQQFAVVMHLNQRWMAVAIRAG